MSFRQLDSLPSEILLTIFSWLPVRTLPPIFRVCSSFAQIANRDAFWEIVYHHSYISSSSLLSDDEESKLSSYFDRVKALHVLKYRVDVPMWEDPERRKLAAKVVLFGVSAVGKTSLIIRHLRNEFHEYQESTIGAAFLTKGFDVISDPAHRRILNGVTFVGEFWDLAGEERFSRLPPMYYRGCSVFIAVFDLSDRNTLDSPGLCKFLEDGLQSTDYNPIVVLVGNKRDLKTQRQVSHEQIQAFRKRYSPNIRHYIETSAKTGENVKELFEWIGNESLRCWVAQMEREGRLDADGGGFVLGEDIDDREGVNLLGGRPNRDPGNPCSAC